MLAGFVNLPAWLISGPFPVIAIILVGLVLVVVWINYRLNIIQRNLHDVGKTYYVKEQDIIDQFKSGLISESEYRKQHDRLVNEMREETRRMTDGPPK